MNLTTLQLLMQSGLVECLQALRAQGFQDDLGLDEYGLAVAPDKEPGMLVAVKYLPGGMPRVKERFIGHFILGDHGAVWFTSHLDEVPFRRLDPRFAETARGLVDDLRGRIMYWRAPQHIVEDS